MAIAKITGQGLALIALAVALLWTCFIAERLMVRRANEVLSRTVRSNQILKMRQRAQPASEPRLKAPAPVRRALG